MAAANAYVYLKAVVTTDDDDVARLDYIMDKENPAWKNWNAGQTLIDAGGKFTFLDHGTEVDHE